MRLRRPASAAAFLLLLAAPAAAQPVRNIPGFRASTLQANDDGYSDAVGLVGFSPDGLNFFGTTYQSLWVNNNGNVTFNNALTAYDPLGLTTNTGTPIIAPFFADVDTRGPSMRGSGSGEPNYGNRPQPFDGSGLVTYGFSGVNGHSAFGVNWFSDCFFWTGDQDAGPSCTGIIGTGYNAGMTRHLNVFQLLLIDRSDIASGDFDIEFNYDAVTWNTGAANGGDADGRGGASAHVGYSNGTGDPGTFFEFGGSGVDGALLDNGPAATSLVHNSNVGMNGRYLMTVRGGQVTARDIPTTATPEPSSLALVGLGGAALLGVVERRRRRST